MNQYMALIHGNAKSRIAEKEWNEFFTIVRESGFFRGGSEIGQRYLVVEADSTKSTELPAAEFHPGYTTASSGAATNSLGKSSQMS